MANTNIIFGLDFGTSKTVITQAQAGAMNPPVVDLAIDGQSDRIATCVLRDKTSGRVYVGNKADQEYKLVQDPEARGQLEFFSNFKPHIHQNPADRAAALLFLTQIRQSERLTQEFARTAGEAVVIAGCPVSWMANGAKELLHLLAEAGFPPAYAIPEPVGAAFYYIGSRLKAQDFHHDIVVFDWGAGTFDMTVLRAGRLEFEGSETWGSSLFGGRLFDDLFYQWALEIAARQGHDEGLTKLAERPVESEYLHGVKARQIKEDFSRFYRDNPAETDWIWELPLVIGAGARRINLGDFLVPHIGEFDQRMGAYRASAMARRWIELAVHETRPEEKAFVEALRAGEPVDLRAWGTALIETGLRRLDVREGATAVLTGGSCNWKWFADHVRAVPPFAGRAMAVLSDDKPELTIARGLARVYPVGGYAKRLIGEVAAARQALIEPFRRIHAETLEKLSFSLNALMKADATLEADLTHVFREALDRATATDASPKGWQDMVRGLVDRVVNDKAAEAIRPELERRIGDWLRANRAKVATYAERFSRDAYQRIMEALKAQIHSEIGGLVEVAIEACGATGATSLDEALRQLGGKVRFQRNMVAGLYAEIMKLIGKWGKKERSAAERVTELKTQTKAALERFHLALPEAVRANIAELQSAEQWSAHVMDHLLATLQTLVRIARVDDVRAATPMAAPATT